MFNLPSKEELLGDAGEIPLGTVVYKNEVFFVSIEDGEDTEDAPLGKIYDITNRVTGVTEFRTPSMHTAIMYARGWQEALVTIQEQINDNAEQAELPFTPDPAPTVN